MTTISSPSLSIVTPVYNGERFIDETIQAVVGQTFTDWEWIIVDDCSTDRTVERVREWAARDARIRLLCLEKNFGGPAGPRNVGAREASAERVAFLDADDIWHPRKLEIQLAAMGDRDFSCTAMKDFHNPGALRFAEYPAGQLPPAHEVTFGQMSLRNRIPTSSVVIRRQLLLEMPFLEDPRYKAVEDYHCWLRLLQEGHTCLKLDWPLLGYRIIDGQISGSKWKQMKKVFMVHRELPGRGLLAALLLMVPYALGATYSRLIMKEL